MRRLLITGAGGNLGREARARLTGMADVLRLTDIVEMDPAGPNEEVIRADLADAEAVMSLVEGCDGIVHFGGASRELDFETVLQGNIRGIFNLYEAARAHGHPRIFFASSNHAIGFYEVTQRIDGDVPPIADGLYGASKVYGEQIALLYWHRYGQETARVRIGSCFDAPRDRRMLATWISFRDLFSMVERTFTVPRLGCPVIYGASDNSANWWDNSKAEYIGWRPQDSADGWREALETGTPPDPQAPEVRYQGGGFVSMPIRRTADD